MAGDDFDSGMESQNENPESKDLTPEKTPKPITSGGNEFDDEPDETLTERLWGLTEMFPESVRQTCGTLTNVSSSGVKGLYSLSRSVLWIFFSSSVILFAPVLFEVERAQLEDMQRNQQKQMLLGPNSAVSGGHGMPPLLPPISR